MDLKKYRYLIALIVGLLMGGPAGASFFLIVVFIGDLLGMYN